VHAGGFHGKKKSKQSPKHAKEDELVDPMCNHDLPISVSRNYSARRKGGMGNPQTDDEPVVRTPHLSSKHPSTEVVTARPGGTATGGTNRRTEKSAPPAKRSSQHGTPL